MGAARWSICCAIGKRGLPPSKVALKIRHGKEREKAVRIACFDCFSGISGDMILGALLDVGVDPQAWRAALDQLQVPGYDIAITPVKKQGIAGVRVEVRLHEADTGHGRHLSDIAEILERSQLPENVRKRALAVFARLANAEAKIHATTPEAIHFHEVGAVDAIVDIVGACIGLEMLGVEKVYCSPLPFSSGWVECAHGQMPLPAPATLELLSGFTLRFDPRQEELITPTGAAILAEFAERDAQGHVLGFPPLRLLKVGYGAGSRDTEQPNLLRLCLAEELTLADLERE